MICTLSVSYAVEVVVSAVSMCSHRLSVYVVQPDGRVTAWVAESVCAAPYPSSHAFQVPPCAAWEVEFVITPDVVVQDTAPLSKPGLANFCPGLEQPVPTGFTVQLNDVLAVAAAESCAVTVTLDVPAVVGVPEITPLDALTDRPAGR